MLAKLITENGASLVVFDPIQSFVEGSTNSERTVRHVLGPLSAVAEQTNAAIVLVRHLRKSGSGLAIHRGLGSTGIVDVARSGLMVATEPGLRTVKELEIRRVLAQFKCNLSTLAPSLVYLVVTESDGARIEWLGESKLSADQLASTTDGMGASALAEACEVLFALLIDGALRANEVISLAARNGISSRTLRRAKVRLEVRSIRTGYGRGAEYYWKLPDDSEFVERLKAQAIDELSNSLFHGRCNEFDRSPPYEFH